MSSSPDPDEILAAAALLVRDELLPALSGELAFKARLLANALDLVRRQWVQTTTEDPAKAAQEDARLRLLAGGAADTQADPQAELVRRIATGSLSPDDPRLLDHLWQTTLSRIAVDQPHYASYRAEVGQG
jgi:hypothetical protein